MYKLIILLLICPVLHSEELDKILWGDSQLTSPLNFDFISSEFKNYKENNLSGIYSINSSPIGLGFEVLKNDNVIQSLDSEKILNNFPKFSIPISITNNRVTVLDKKIIETNHHFWDLSFSDGKAWNDNKNIFVSIPFALLQKNANCVHNGILVFALDKPEKVSKSIVQISSETCSYFQFNYVAIFDSSFEKKELILNKDIKEFNTRNFVEIYDKYPNIEQKSFADSDGFSSSEVTAYGFYDGEDHFIGPCKTRSGDYPFCDDILLPAYSLTKTISGTFGVAAYQKKYGFIEDLRVRNLISSCSHRKWKDVTLENLADMTTGNYKSSQHSVDEDSLASLNFIFNLKDSSQKEKFACNNYPNKSKPGQRFVYHSSDTYLLGVALNNLLQEKVETDFFDDLLVPIFSDINLSEKIKYTRRTIDENRQPYTGWGMFFERDDLLKINKLLRSSIISEHFSEPYINEALQQTDDKGFLAIKSSNIYYNNGLWSAKFDKNIFGCKHDIYVPFMSGFGGITVVFLPNSMIYYYVSDSFTFSWYAAVYAAHQMKPLC